jgi:hypothetical protein
MDTVSMPDGTGIEVGGGSQNRVLAMQMHYNNKDKKAGLVDRGSGLRVFLTAEKPATTIINVMTGLSPLSDRMRIPVDMQDFRVSSNCRMSLLKPVTVYGYSLHAHIYGTKIVSDVIRNGKVVFEIGREARYSYDYQRFVYYKDENLPTLELQDGDLIRTRCWYDTRRSRKSFREASLTDHTQFEVSLTERERDKLLAHVREGSYGQIGHVREGCTEYCEQESGYFVNSSFNLGGKRVSAEWTPHVPSNGSNGSWIAEFSAPAVAGGYGSGDEMCMSVLILGDAKDVRGGRSCLATDAETTPFAPEGVVPEL